MNGNGRSIVITGASRGIGAATARLAGQRGYRVCVNYNGSEKAAGEVVAAIRDAGGEAFAFRASTVDETAVEEMFASVAERFGGLDALVNNAGIYGELRRVEDMSAAELREIFDVNVVGCFICAREAIRLMSTQRGGKGGRIVNVSSIAGANGGSGGRSHYASTKGAVNTFTLGLAKEAPEHGITVNTFSPGLTLTDLNTPDRIERIEPTIPLKRAGQPEEMAAGIMWLLSDEAGYCLGANLTMSGGR